MSTELLDDAPANLLRLPRDVRGYPVPWFVKWYDGKPDFRVIAEGKFERAVAGRRCWICGEILGRYLSFVVGPMCTVNRTSAEPPSHRDCANYAAMHCPFLATPRMHRREKNLPEHKEMPGFAILDNPGVCAVWTTTRFGTYATRTGPMIELGEPTNVAWFAHGRGATRVEILDAMTRGIPKLAALCRTADDRVLLDDMVRMAQRWIPREDLDDAGEAGRSVGTDSV